MEIFKQIDKVLEEVKLNEQKKIYIPPTVMPKAKNKLVDALVDLQNKIHELQKQLEDLKAQKGKIEAPIMDYLQKVKADGIRLEKILIYVTRGKSSPSFWQVYEAVRKELTPKIDKLLRETYEKLQVVKEPRLTVKTTSKESITEGWWENLKDWFKKTFAPLLNSFSQGLTKVEKLLGLSESIGAWTYEAEEKEKIYFVDFTYTMDVTAASEEEAKKKAIAEFERVSPTVGEFSIVVEEQPSVSEGKFKEGQRVEDKFGVDYIVQKDTPKGLILKRVKDGARIRIPDELVRGFIVKNKEG